MKLKLNLQKQASAKKKLEYRSYYKVYFINFSYRKYKVKLRKRE